MKQWAEAELQGSLAQSLPGQTLGSTGPALEHPGLDGGGWRRGRRDEAGLKEGLFGCSTQWVPCWKEVWTQFVSVVNLITASMRGWSHREQVPLTAEPWSKPCSPRRWPCASCSLFSPLHIVSLLFHFCLFIFLFCHLCLSLYVFLCRYPRIICSNGELMSQRDSRTVWLALSFMADLHRAFCPLLVAPLLLCPPSVIHTCLDQSGQSGFNNPGQNS